MPLLYFGAILLIELHFLCRLEAICSEIPMEEIQSLYRNLLPLYLGLPDQLEEARMIKDKQLFIGDAQDGLKKTNKQLIILVPEVGGMGKEEGANIFLLCGLLCGGHRLSSLIFTTTLVIVSGLEMMKMRPQRLKYFARGDYSLEVTELQFIHTCTSV